MRERPLNVVPGPLLGLLAAAFCAQLAFKGVEARPTGRAADLQPPPTAMTARVLGAGDPIALAQGLLLYVQAYDNQPGISIPYKDLDYGRLEDWLARVLELDPRGQYPMLLASQVYSQVPDPVRQRMILEWTYQRFLEDPARRWRWAAHAAIMAKHKLGDLPLALRYAEGLNRFASDPSVPDWAKQMHIFVLEDMGEVESAKVLLGGLLASGSITDPHEIHFLTERLNALEKPAENSSKPSETRLR